MRLRQALRDRRFALAILMGNFVVLLVLLVPCTDWFITFSQLGRGDTLRAVAFTPLNLILQWLLLPAYLWLMADETGLGGWSMGRGL